jgi:tRNA1(Val) A37 N6-methylase TrmN6
MERIEDLGINEMKIYQDDELYKFTSDAVLLTRFTKVKKGDVVADFCSGSGIVGLHLYALNPEKIKSVTLFEMQKSLFYLSLKSIELNGLRDIFSAVNVKVQDISSEYAGKFTLITCNPPYMPVGHGFYEKDEQIAVCRTELKLPLNELVKSIGKALTFGGRVNMVHRADRLVDVICEFKKNNIEPKTLQFVSGGKKEPYLFMIEGVKGGKSGIKILNTIEN